WRRYARSPSAGSPLTVRLRLAFMPKIVLCDLDGTLSDTKHRERFVRQKPRDYDSFFAAAGDDDPIPAVIAVVKALKAAGYDIHIITGRRDDTRSVTEGWLREHGVPYDRLVMREFHDHTPDDDLKRDWFQRDYVKEDILCV